MHYRTGAVLKPGLHSLLWLPVANTTDCPRLATESITKSCVQTHSTVPLRRTWFLGLGHLIQPVRLVLKPQGSNSTASPLPFLFICGHTGSSLPFPTSTDARLAPQIPATRLFPFPMSKQLLLLMPLPQQLPTPCPHLHFHYLCPSPAFKSFHAVARCLSKPLS